MKKKKYGTKRMLMGRMLKLHQKFARGEHANAPALMREMEVSAKTVRRDLEFMRENMGLPVEFDAKLNGFRYTRPVEDFPGACPATKEEVFALLVAAGDLEGTPFYGPLRTLLRKTVLQVDPAERKAVERLQRGVKVTAFGPQQGNFENLAQVREALESGRRVRFAYRKISADRPELRKVEPYEIRRHEGVWYMIGLDQGRGQIRTFAISRMSQVTVMDERCVLPVNFDSGELLGKSFGIMEGHADYEVVIEFDAFATDVLRNRRWHATQELQEVGNGHGRMTLRLSGLEEVKSWVMWWGEHATVIRPRALVEMVAVGAKMVAEKYAN